MVFEQSILGECISYIRQGSGTPVVVLHGNRASAKVMLPLIEALSNSYQVYAPDMSGFGNSSYRRRKARVDAYAAEMAAFLEALDIKEAAVIGWSFGGAVAQELAKISHRVKSIVLLSSVGAGGIDALSITTDGDEYRDLNRIEAKRERTKDMLAEILFDGDLPKAYHYVLEEALVQKNSLDVYFAMRHYKLEHPRHIPVLILHGENDHVVGVQEAVELYRHYPWGRMEILGGGHFLIYNHCGEVFKHIESFLKDVEEMS